MVKNISNQEIKRKRRDLIQQKEKSNKNFYQMVDDLDEEIYKLKEEKNDSQILTEKYQKEILNTDKKIEEKSEEKRKYAHAWLSYIGILDGDKSIKKIIHIALGILYIISAVGTVTATKNLSIIPVTLGMFAILDVLLLAVNKSDIKKEIKTLKVRHFGKEDITEEEMQEIIKAKEKEIDSELDKLNETRRNLVNTQQETHKKIDKISKEQEELEINRKILIQEIVRNADKEDYIEDYLNDEIKEYCNLISKQPSSSEEKPKVQSKRLKAIGKEN